MYKIGGWIAKAGSCRMGFKPKPSLVSIGLIKKGLDVRITNKEKHKYKKHCKTIVSFCTWSFKIVLNEKETL